MEFSVNWVCFVQIALQSSKQMTKCHLGKWTSTSLISVKTALWISWFSDFFPNAMVPKKL